MEEQRKHFHSRYLAIKHYLCFVLQDGEMYDRTLAIMQQIEDESVYPFHRSDGRLESKYLMFHFLSVKN